MGQSTDGILVFGVNIGEEDNLPEEMTGEDDFFDIDEVLAK